MEIRQSELCERLTDDDDEGVRSTLRNFFEPRSRPGGPLGFEWWPRLDLQVILDEDNPDANLIERAARRVKDLANQADGLLRQRRYRRRREANPDWPVVLCEGDSWVAHPYVTDIGDHLFKIGERGFNLLNVGAAGDRLLSMARELEHERVLDEIDAAALLLSGGGNDLLIQFDEFLRDYHPGDDPARLVDDAFEDRMVELMGIMRRVVGRVRSRLPAMPILVHGYDHLRVREYGKGRYLGPHFDRAGIRDPEERQATLTYIVDRFNHHLEQTLASLDNIDYIDVRAQVKAGEWKDEIHPKSDGFETIATKIGERLTLRIGVDG